MKAMQLQYHHELLPRPDRKIQANLTVNDRVTQHYMVWDYRDAIDPESPEAEQLEFQGHGKGTGAGQFVRDLKLENMVTVWAHARFRDGSITFRDAKIEVYYAV